MATERAVNGSVLRMYRFKGGGASMVWYGAEGQRGRGLVWGLLRWVAVWWCGGLVWCGVAWFGVGVVVCGVVGAAVNAIRLSLA